MPMISDEDFALFQRLRGGGGQAQQSTAQLAPAAQAPGQLRQPTYSLPSPVGAPVAAAQLQRAPSAPLAPGQAVSSPPPGAFSRAPAAPLASTGPSSFAGAAPSSPLPTAPQPRYRLPAPTAGPMAGGLRRF